MEKITRGIIEEVREDLAFGFLDEALKTLQTNTVPKELLKDAGIREAALRGIRQHLIDSRFEGDIDTAIRIRDLFNVSNVEVEEDAKQGIENWTMDKGPEFGEKIRLAFGVSESFMKSTEMEEARRRWTRLQSERESMLKQNR